MNFPTCVFLVSCVFISGFLIGEWTCACRDRRNLVKHGMAEWRSGPSGGPEFFFKHYLAGECERYRRDTEYFRDEVERLSAKVKSLKSAKKVGEKQC